MEILEINDEGLMPADAVVPLTVNILSSVRITGDFDIIRLSEREFTSLSSFIQQALYIISDQQLNAHNKTVISVADPSIETDGVNKRYVDTQLTAPVIINTNIANELVNTSNNVSANGIYINDNQQKRAALLQLEAYSTNQSNGDRKGDTLYKMTVNRGLDVPGFTGNNEAVLGVGLHAVKNNAGNITNYQGFTVCPTPQEDSNTNEIATTKWITDRIASLINVLSTNI